MLSSLWLSSRVLTVVQHAFFTSVILSFYKQIKDCVLAAWLLKKSLATLFDLDFWPQNSDQSKSWVQLNACTEFEGVPSKYYWDIVSKEDRGTPERGIKLHCRALLNPTFEFSTGGRVRFMHGGTQIIYLELITAINIVREERKRQRER